jgi:hypothetical protein
MRARADAVPPVEIDPEEDGLEEEGESLERERHPDQRTGVPHEARPEQAELEREHRARDRADGEQHRRALRPAVREIEIRAVPSAPPPPLGEHHQQRHRDPDLGEDDVEAE